MSSQSQTNRVQPYTPRGTRPPATGGSAAPRAEMRSLRGQGSNRDGATDTSESDRVMAAIASLSAKVDQEFLLLSNRLQEEVMSVSLKIDEDIATLTNKVEEDLGSMTDKIDHGLLSLSNKLDQVNETVEDIPHAPAAAVSTPMVQTPSPPAWMYSTELKEKVYAFAYESVAQPTIAAYTALENPNGDLIANSLFNTIRRRIREIPGDWPTEQLPPVVDGVSNVAATQKYTSLLKDAGKHARERLHIAVLHNIKNNPEATVPNIKRCLARIANQCGLPNRELDAPAYWRTTTWAQRLRIAYIRREAVCIFQAIRRGEGGGNIWRRVDRQLHKLAEEGTLYTGAFYSLVYNQDLDSFDGRGYFSSIDPAVTFDLPSDEDIIQEMDRLEQAGSTGALNELGLQD
ncbi:hypothetical protein DFH28DRAFT_1083242 [Melampsora americana]|nr:hypothetical protein DFH28DRAFT_1083242 [Melampsora americana]